MLAPVRMGAHRETARGCIAFVALVLSLLATRVTAQDAGSTTPDAGTAAPEVAPNDPATPEPVEEPEADRPDPAEEARETLRGAHLGELATRTRTALQTARPLQRANDAITDIQRRLPRTEVDLERLGHPSRLARISQLSQRELADLRQEWRRYGTMLEEWQSTLVERAGELEQVRSELVELRRQWAALRRASDTAGRPEGRHERIVTSLELSRDAATELDGQRELVLGLQDRVSELSIVVEDVTEQLRAASAAYRDRLFVRDATPLWEGLRGATATADERSLATQARESFMSSTESPDELAASLAPGVVRQFFVFALLAGLVLSIQRRSRSWPDDDETLAIARTIVARPFSTALLVTLLATPALVRNAPIALYDVVFFLLLVPLARVLPPLAATHVRPILYFLVGFLLVNRIESTMPEGTELRRVVLLLECMIAIAALGFWAQYTKQGDRLTGFLRGVAATAAIMLALGLIANVLGYFFLAEMIGVGTGFSVYTGLTLVAAVVVAQALLDLAIRSDAGHFSHAFREYGALIHRRVLGVLSFAAFVLWAFATLDGYGVGASLWKWAAETLEEPWDIGNLHLSLGAIVAAIMLLVVTHYTARCVRFLLEVDVLPRMKLEPGVDGAISGISRYVIYGGGLLLALTALGIDASQITLVAGALGVGIGFGLQNIVANFFAGLILMLERPVRIGDFIEISPLVGTVSRIGLRSSTVRAPDGAEVIVPNEKLISREVVNWTLSDRKRRVEVKVSVAYGTDPHRVLEILRCVAQEHAEVTKDAVPSASFAAFGDSSLDFALQFWTSDFGEAGRIRSEVGLRVHDALTEAGIEIPFPQRDLHVKSLPEGFIVKKP
jgi:small-conductance mechanosensitive channel